MMIDRVRQLDYYMNNDYKEVEHIILPILNKYLSEEWVSQAIPSWKDSNFDIQFSNGDNIILFSCLYGNNISTNRLDKNIVSSIIQGEEVLSTIFLAKNFSDKARMRIYKVSQKFPIQFQLLDIDFLKNWARDIDDIENP